MKTAPPTYIQEVGQSQTHRCCVTPLTGGIPLTTGLRISIIKWTLQLPRVGRGEEWGVAVC